MVNSKGIKLALKNLGRFRHRQLSEPFLGININILTYTYDIEHKDPTILCKTV
jgi:hypothetical protein